MLSTLPALVLSQDHLLNKNKNVKAQKTNQPNKASQQSQPKTLKNKNSKIKTNKHTIIFTNTHTPQKTKLKPATRVVNYHYKLTYKLRGDR